MDRLETEGKSNIRNTDFIDLYSSMDRLETGIDAREWYDFREFIFQYG